MEWLKNIETYLSTQISYKTNIVIRIKFPFELHQKKGIIKKSFYTASKPQIR